MFETNLTANDEEKRLIFKKSQECYRRTIPTVSHCFSFRLLHFHLRFHASQFHLHACSAIFSRPILFIPFKYVPFNFDVPPLQPPSSRLSRSPHSHRLSYGFANTIVRIAAASARGIARATISLLNMCTHVPQTRARLEMFEAVHTRFQRNRRW